MSLHSWLDEYIPTCAEDFAGKELTIENLIEATKHSLHKWKGITTENTNKHNIIITKSAGYRPFYFLSDNGYNLYLSDSTCALCQIIGTDCKSCPLYKANKVDCNMWDSGFNKFYEFGDSSRMISELEITLEYLKSQNS
jgi:hypothetical protein